MTPRFLSVADRLPKCLQACLLCVALLPAAALAGVRVLPQDSGVHVRLRGISAVDADVAWASGREGTVLRTIDGGAHWTSVPVPDAKALDFRDVEGFDADTAVVLSIGPGEDSRVYRTEDGGRTWRLALQNHDPKGFLDCMAFDGAQGWLMGDPVDGAFQVYRSVDGGRSWTLLERLPEALPDEAAFAASGTCVAVAGGEPAIVTGGGASRVLRQAATGDWRALDSGLRPRVPAAGVFSAARDDAGLLLVGGDFEHEAEPAAAARIAIAADDTLAASALPPTRGYRSGAACAQRPAGVCIAVGPTGVDALVDGAWQPVGDTGYDAIDLAGDAGWASGDDGRIARVTVDGN